MPREERLSRITVRLAVRGGNGAPVGSAGAGVVELCERKRSPRPQIAKRANITDYSDSELERIVRWILEAELLTDDEVVDRAIKELGFQKRGSRIEAAIRRASASVRFESRSHT